MKNKKTLDLRPVLPNAVTMTALAFGVSSLNMAFWGQWRMAVLFIILSGLFDFLDGKVARMLGVSSKFGAELDSLSDFVSFGVAPGFLMYQWTMDSALRIEVLSELAKRSDAIGVHWIWVVFLSMCCATRLARFNTQLDQKTPPYWHHFFMGVPAPAGAFLAILPLIFWLASGETFSVLRNPQCAGLFLAFSGIMMASKIPTLSLKHIHLSAQYRSALLIVGLAVLAGLVTAPWIVLSLLSAGYLLSIPATVFFFLKFKKKSTEGSVS